jgi:hypothetical protein
MSGTKRETVERVNEILLDELAEEAKRFVELLEELKGTPKDSEKYDELDGEVYASVVHLKVHAATLQESLDEIEDLESLQVV